MAIRIVVPSHGIDDTLPLNKDAAWVKANYSDSVDGIMDMNCTTCTDDEGVTVFTFARQTGTKG